MPDKKERSASICSTCIPNERGSALVLVMFIALLFTILGVTVLSAAVGGAQRTETRKNDVQSLHLAEKTLEETIAYITAELESRVVQSNKSNKSQAELANDINSYLGSLRPSDLRAASTELTAANGKIKDIDYQAGQSVSYKLILTAEADVNGVQRELTQEIIFDTFPDFLKYTLGTEGDLTINGSPEVTGNIYAGNRLFINDEAQYYFNLNSLTLPSSPFELIEGGGLKDSGEAHIQSLDDVIYTQNGRSISAADMLDPNGLERKTDWTGTISMDKLRIKSQRKFVQMNVEESFLDKVMEAIGDRAGVDRSYVRDKINSEELAEFLSAYMPKYEVPGDIPVKPSVPEESENSEEFDEPDVSEVPKAPEESEELDEAEVPEMPIEPEEPDAAKLWANYREQIGQFTKPKQSIVLKGNMIFDGVELDGIEYENGIKNGWYIVNGNLKIDNYSDEAIQITANILVTGNLEIRGNVQLDSTMFVQGSTTVEDASIGGIGAVIISKGEILVNRLDAFASTTQTLNAFFYTDNTAKLYGVGSIFSLNGGFFAKESLTVNAVRGEASPGGSVILVNKTGLIRFTAKYDDQIYMKQVEGLPRVNNVSVKVGNIRLK